MNVPAGEESTESLDSSAELTSPINQFSDDEFAQQLQTIPEKLAFKIGEVAKLAGIKQYVLRYWEAEFESLAPRKSHHNQRMYSRKDVEMVLMIKKLLYKDKFSITGARAALKRLKTKTRTEGWKDIVKKHNKAQLKAKSLLADIQKLRKQLEN